jgi:hypothetical protein
MAEYDVFGSRGERANVEYLDFPEYGDVRDKAIDPRSNIDVPCRISL